MSDESIDWKAKFPNMQPVKGAPSMFTLNGFGLTVYGKRDEDRETRTYVLSRCFCAIFIPVFWLDAYRVHKAAENSYYFIGREPLSGVCKLWNMLIISSVCVLGGYGYWVEHTKSPDYIAARHLNKAKEFKASGKFAESLTALSTVMAMRTKRTAEAMAEFDALAAERFDKADAGEACTLLQVAITHKLQSRASPESAEWYKRAAARAKELSATDAAGARRLLKIAGPLAQSKEEKESFAALSNELLEKAVAQNPGNLNLLSEWAEIVEAKGDPAALKKLLEPHKAKLGTTEAARMLGQIYAHEGEFDASYTLLEPYTTGRLKALHAAEQQYDVVAKAASDNALARLRKGGAGDAWYRIYEASNETKKQELVDKYIYDAMRADASMKNAEKKIAAEAKIVPVALDFGIVRLQRARNIADAAAKKKELEAAEKVFLAIRGTAGESDTYMLYYGQVLFWLERAEEGKQQFEQLLTKNKRDAIVLLTLANIYRELGDYSAAIKLADEAYTTATDPQVKFSAASVRVISSHIPEDKILWLGRCDPKDISTQATLAETEADLALREGDKVLAIKKYRDAIRIYETLPRNETTLNNTSLKYSSLFAATGDRADFRKAVEMQLDALAMKAQDPILMLNAANSLTTNAMLDIMGPNVDYSRTGGMPMLNHRTHLYSDEATRAVVTQRLAGHKDIQQAVSILERLLLLSPRSESAYSLLANIYGVTDNDAGMKALRDRLKTVELDVERSRDQALDFQKNGVKPAQAQAMKLRMGKMESSLKELTPASDPLTRSLALDATRMQLWALNMVGESDVNRLVQLAEEQHKALPTADSRDNLADACIARAVDRIAQLRPDWKKLYEETRKKTSLLKLLPGFVESAGELRAKILADADIQKAIALLRESSARLPLRGRIDDWKMMQNLDPELAAGIAKALLKNDAAEIRCEVTYLLEPYSSTDAVDYYWSLQLRGDAAAAEKVKKETVGRGMPWPVP